MANQVNPEIAQILAIHRLEEVAGDAVRDKCLAVVLEAHISQPTTDGLSIPPPVRRRPRCGLVGRLDAKVGPLTYTR